LLAVKNNHLSAAILLIDMGDNINAQAANKDSPWLLAGALGRTEMLRHMIPKGPDFTLRNRFGGNALIPACERAHVETVKLLLTTNIDVNHVNILAGPVSSRSSFSAMVDRDMWKLPNWFSPPVLIRILRTRMGYPRSLTHGEKAKLRLPGLSRLLRAGEKQIQNRDI
jgi:Ankyrin repeats (3 copies)